jgi:hypothetical protein
MVILPYSPIACALVTTTMFAIFFYVGKLCGIKQVMDFIMEEVEKSE